MRILRLLKGSAWTFGTVLLLAFLAVFTVVEWPRWVFNSIVLGRIAEAGGMALTWKTDRIEVQSLSFWEKRIRLEFGDLCVDSPKTRFNACFSSATIGFAYSFKDIIPKVTEVGPVSLRGGVAEYTPISNKPTHLPLPSSVRTARLEPVEVQFVQFHMNKPTARTSGSVFFRLSGKNLNLVAEGVERGHAPAEPVFLSTHWGATNHGDTLFGPWAFAGDTSVRFLKNDHLHVHVTGDPRSISDYRYAFTISGSSPSLDTVAQIHGEFTPESVIANLDQTLRLRKRAIPAWPELSQGEIRGCRLEFAQRKEDPKRAGIDLHCPFYVDLPRIAHPRLRLLSQRLGLVHQALFAVHSHLETVYPPNPRSPFAGSLDVFPGRIFSPVLRTSGGLRTELSAIPIELPALKAMDARLHFAADIPEFGKLVKALEGTPVAVPAPFQALRGSIHWEADGHGTLGSGRPESMLGGQLSLGLRSHLASPRRTQELTMDGQGSADVRANQRPILVATRFELLLNDIKFGLPKIGVESKPPQLAPDPRLEAGSFLEKTRIQSEKQGFALTYDLRVRTPPSHPIRIESTLTAAPIPIIVNARVRSPEKFSGFMRIDRFPLDVFGLKKEIGRITVDFAEKPRGGLPIGEIEVQTGPNAYTSISPIEVAGQAAGQAAQARESPKFAIPIPRIASSLFFGTPVNEVATSPAISTSPPDFTQWSHSNFLNVRKRY